jgi:hypothetical protein
MTTFIVAIQPFCKFFFFAIRLRNELSARSINDFGFFHQPFLPSASRVRNSLLDHLLFFQELDLYFSPPPGNFNFTGPSHSRLYLGASFSPALFCRRLVFAATNALLITGWLAFGLLRSRFICQ